MIQLKENEKSKDGYFDIYIDQNSYSYGWAFRPSNKPDEPFQYGANSGSAKRLTTQTLEDFEPFSVITFNNLFYWMKKGHSIIIAHDFHTDTQEEIILITFYFSPNLTVWNDKFSFADYCKEFEAKSDNLIEIDYDLTFEETPALRLEFYFKKFFCPIIEILTFLEGIIEEINQKSIKVLHEEFDKDIVKAIFNFPEELKNQCEQYLQYFATFLKDLGINASSNLKEEAGKVLFSVTPTDDVEALDKIREALAIYLKLPESPIIYDDSFASMRLQQQIENLQHSQRMAVRELQFNEKLLVAQSDTIHEKNITISQQQSMIENQNKIIEKISSASVMMNSAENKDELEEVYDGLKVGESDTLKKWLGISLNPAKVIKTAVKNTLGKDSKKSVLGLDEDI